MGRQKKDTGKAKKKRAADKSAGKRKTRNPDEGTWRKITQSSGGGDTKASRARRWRVRLKLAGALVVLLVLAGVVSGVVWFVRENPWDVHLGTTPEPVRTIEFETDGVLTREWLTQFVPGEGEREQYEIDIFALKERLEAQGQVRRASVERVLPDGLRIVLRE